MGAKAPQPAPEGLKPQSSPAPPPPKCHDPACPGPRKASGDRPELAFQFRKRLTDYQVEIIRQQMREYHDSPPGTALVLPSEEQATVYQRVGNFWEPLIPSAFRTIRFDLCDWSENSDMVATTVRSQDGVFTAWAMPSCKLISHEIG